MLLRNGAADLLADCLRPVRGGQSNGLGRIRSRAQAVRAHMRDGRGLSCGSGGGHCRGGGHFTRGGKTDKTATDLFRHRQLTTGEGPCPGYRLTGPAIPRDFRLE